MYHCYRCPDDFGLSFSCYELYRRTKDEQAREVVLTVADTILHKAARDHDGLVAHDDKHYVQWAIPAEQGELKMGDFFRNDRVWYAGRAGAQC